MPVPTASSFLSNEPDVARIFIVVENLVAVRHFGHL